MLRSLKADQPSIFCDVCSVQPNLRPVGDVVGVCFVVPLSFHDIPIAVRNSDIPKLIGGSTFLVQNFVFQTVLPFMFLFLLWLLLVFLLLLLLLLFVVVVVVVVVEVDVRARARAGKAHQKVILHGARARGPQLRCC